MTIHSAYRFGKFELNPSSRAVSKDGIPLRLGGRAFDILALLLSRAGEVVGKEELIAAAWPNLHVEENNLRVHLTALRKVLDDTQPGRSAIANVPSRGYSFVLRWRGLAGGGGRGGGGAAQPAADGRPGFRPLGRCRRDLRTSS